MTPKEALPMPERRTSRLSCILRARRRGRKSIRALAASPQATSKAAQRAPSPAQLRLAAGRFSQNIFFRPASKSFFSASKRFFSSLNRALSFLLSSAANGPEVPTGRAEDTRRGRLVPPLRDDWWLLKAAAPPRNP